jgi:hypothetical protein
MERVAYEQWVTTIGVSADEVDPFSEEGAAQRITGKRVPLLAFASANA